MQLSMFKLLKDILLYSGGSFIGRIATFLLLPLTTSFLTPWDYGIIGILTLVPSFVNGLFSLGFHTSLGRVFSNEHDPAKKEGVIWTAFVALIVNNLFWTALAVAFAKPLSWILLGSAQHHYMTAVTFTGVGICTVRLGFEYYLRASGQSKKVFCLSMLDVTCSISIMLLAVVYLRRGAQGYMEAFALAQTMNLVFMLLLVAPKLHFSIQWQHMRELIHIGLPCIWGFWGYCILQGASRYVLQMSVSEAEAGFYFLGSNLGRVIELPLWGFLSAWVPLFNSYLHKQEEAPAVFSKIMTYYVLGMSCFATAFFCFARPVAYHLLQPPFYNVWTVVGLSAVAQALWGVYGITYPALIFHKKTGLQSCLELSAGALCILLNCLLASYFFKEGAAAATALGFLGLVLTSVYFNQKLMYVPYELHRLLKIVASLAAVATLSFLPIESQLVYTSLMGFTLPAYLAFAWYGILTAEEKINIRETIQKKWVTKPSTLSP